MATTPTSSVRRRLRPEDRREQILAVAEQVFAARGYQGTSLEDIAAAAAITRPLIYSYFTDKDSLYLEILKSARSELESALIAAVAGHQEPGEQLRAGMRAYFVYVQERGSRWDMLFGGGTAVAGSIAEQAAHMRFETTDKIAALILNAAPRVGARAATAYAQAISGAGEQLAKWWRRHPEITLDEILDYQADVVWSGLDRIAAQ